MKRQHVQRHVVTLDQSDCDTLVLSGGLTFATAAEALAKGGRMLAEGAHTRLDLAGLQHADSAGLACVIALGASARRGGRQLEVVNWPEGLRALAEVCDVVGLLGPPATKS